jgi:hypothetical protein
VEGLQPWSGRKMLVDVLAEMVEAAKRRKTKKGQGG